MKEMEDEEKCIFCDEPITLRFTLPKLKRVKISFPLCLSCFKQLKEIPSSPFIVRSRAVAMFLEELRKREGMDKAEFYGNLLPIILEDNDVITGPELIKHIDYYLKNLLIYVVKEE